MPDDLNKHQVSIVPREELLSNILHHFNVLPDEFLYPSKSYVVAIVYARLLVEHFGGDFFKYLDDPDLLYNNDPYFVTYKEDKELYDSIISNVGLLFSLEVGTPAHIVPYFEKEFLIEELGSKK